MATEKHHLIVSNIRCLIKMFFQSTWQTKNIFNYVQLLCISEFSMGRCSILASILSLGDHTVIFRIPLMVSFHVVALIFLKCSSRIRWTLIKSKHHLRQIDTVSSFHSQVHPMNVAEFVEPISEEENGNKLEVSFLPRTSPLTVNILDSSYHWQVQLCIHNHWCYVTKWVTGTWIICIWCAAINSWVFSFSAFLSRSLLKFQQIIIFTPFYCYSKVFSRYCLYFRDELIIIKEGLCRSLSHWGHGNPERFHRSSSPPQFWQPQASRSKRRNPVALHLSKDIKTCSHSIVFSILSHTFKPHCVRWGSI